MIELVLSSLFIIVFGFELFRNKEEKLQNIILISLAVSFMSVLIIYVLYFIMFNDYILLITVTGITGILTSIRILYRFNKDMYLKTLKTIMVDLFNITINSIAVIGSFNIMLFMFNNSSIYVQIFVFLVILIIIFGVRVLYSSKQTIKVEYLITIYASLLVFSLFTNKIITADRNIESYLETEESFYRINEIVQKEELLHVSSDFRYIDHSNYYYITLKEFIILNDYVYSLYQTYEGDGIEYVVQIYDISNDRVIKSQTVEDESFYPQLIRFEEDIFLFSDSRLFSVNEEGLTVYFDYSDETRRDSYHLLYDVDGKLMFQSDTGLYEYDEDTKIFSQVSEAITYDDYDFVYSTNLSLVKVIKNEITNEYTWVVNDNKEVQFNVVSVKDNLIIGSNQVSIDGTLITAESLINAYKYEGRYYIYSDPGYLNQVVILDENIIEIGRYYDTNEDSRDDDYLLSDSFYLNGNRDSEGNYTVYQLVEPVYSIVSIASMNYNFLIIGTLFYAMLPKIKKDV